MNENKVIAKLHNELLQTISNIKCVQALELINGKSTIDIYHIIKHYSKELNLHDEFVSVRWLIGWQKILKLWN